MTAKEQFDARITNYNAEILDLHTQIENELKYISGGERDIVHTYAEESDPKKKTFLEKLEKKVPYLSIPKNIKDAWKDNTDALNNVWKSVKESAGYPDQELNAEDRPKAIEYSIEMAKDNTEKYIKKLIKLKDTLNTELVNLEKDSDQEQKLQQTINSLEKDIQTYENKLNEMLKEIDSSKELIGVKSTEVAPINEGEADVPQALYGANAIVGEQTLYPKLSVKEGQAPVSDNDAIGDGSISPEQSESSKANPKENNNGSAKQQNPVDASKPEVALEISPKTGDTKSTNWKARLFRAMALIGAALAAVLGIYLIFKKFGSTSSLSNSGSSDNTKEALKNMTNTAKDLADAAMELGKNTVSFAHDAAAKGAKKLSEIVWGKPNTISGVNSFRPKR